jgi:hypothetical protein
MKSFCQQGAVALGFMSEEFRAPDPGPARGGVSGIYNDAVPARHLKVGPVKTQPAAMMQGVLAKEKNTA